MRKVFFVVLFLAFPWEITAQSVSPEPELRPGRERLITQNLIARQANLRVVANEDTLRQMVTRGALIKVPETGRGYWLDLKLSHPVATPETVEFVGQLGSLYADSFPGHQLKISSVTRTVSDHQRIRRRIPSAASCVTAERCSPHLFGLVFDVSKKPMNSQQIRYLRQALLALQRQGRVSVFEEMAGNNFHVLVIPDRVHTATSGR